MCLLSVFPENVQPNATDLFNAADSNPDGFGYAIVVPSEGRIIRRHSMDSSRLIDEFLETRDRYASGPALFHCRITTDGVTDIDNCHPFLVGGDPSTVMAHNGILPDRVRPAKGDPRSDTRICAEAFLPGHPFMKLDRRGARKQFEQWLGNFSKVAFLTVDPKYRRNLYIINEGLGHWLDKPYESAWHSNHSYAGWSTSGSFRHTWPVGSSVVPYRTSTVIGGWSSYNNDDYAGSNHCTVCGAFYSVNLVTGYCREEGCKACQECYEPIDTCLCYLPESVRKDVIEEAKNRIYTDSKITAHDAIKDAKADVISYESDDLEEEVNDLLDEWLSEEVHQVSGETRDSASVSIVPSMSHESESPRAIGSTPEPVYGRATAPDMVPGWTWCTDGHGYWWAERESWGRSPEGGSGRMSLSTVVGAVRGAFTGKKNAS